MKLCVLCPEAATAVDRMSKVKDITVSSKLCNWQMFYSGKCRAKPNMSPVVTSWKDSQKNKATDLVGVVVSDSLSICFQTVTESKRCFTSYLFTSRRSAYERQRSM